MRISKDEYYLGIAKAVAKRSTCLRRQYGAVVVKNDQIISTGYNGSARGADNCCDVGVCWREAHNVPHGEQYEKCLSGETRIKTLDGQSPKIEDVVGEELDVLAVDKHGNIVRAKACNIRITGIRNDLCRVLFDDGTELICTRDHKIMMADSSYKEAKDLLYRDAVMSYSEHRHKHCYDPYVHRITRVTFIDTPTPVYDLEVPEHHNFAVYLNKSTGVFVHNCVAVHAEDNAINQAGRESMGATLYLAGFEGDNEIAAAPCVMCERKIRNAQIERVVTWNGHGVEELFRR